MVAERNMDKSLLFKLIFVACIIVAGVSVPILQYGALGIFCIMILRADKNRILQILAFTAPFDVIFKTSKGGFTFYNLLILVAIIKMIFFSPKKTKIKINQLIYVSFLAAFSLIPMTLLGQGRYNEVIFLVATLIIIICLLEKPEEIDYHNFLRFFACGIALASTFAIFADQIPNLNTYVKYEKMRVGGSAEKISRFGGLNGSANHYTISLSMVISGLFTCSLYKKLQFSDVLLMGIILIFGLMSISKSFILSIAILLIMALLFQLRKSLKKGIATLIIISVLLLLVFLLIKDTEMFSSIVARFSYDTTTTNLDDLTTGRTRIWRKFFGAFKENLRIALVGAGCHTMGNYMGISPHNFFIETIYSLGIVGSFIYITAIKSAMPKIKVPKKDWRGYIPFFIFLARGMAVVLFYKEALFLYYIIIYMAMYDANISERERTRDYAQKNI